MRVVEELIKELETMEAREEKVKNARTFIHSAIGALRRCLLEESSLLAIEGDLFEAIRCLDE